MFVYSVIKKRFYFKFVLRNDNRILGNGKKEDFFTFQRLAVVCLWKGARLKAEVDLKGDML